MTTVSTNSASNVFGVLRQLAFVAFSAACFFVVGNTVAMGGNPFDALMVGIFFVGVLAALPVIREPNNVVSEFFTMLFMMYGFVAVLPSIFMVIPWLVGFSVVNGTVGFSDPNALGALLWLPVYFGFPAFLAISKHRSQ